MRQSCVSLGVSRLWNDEKFSPHSLRAGATRLIRGCDEGRELEYSVELPRGEAFRRMFGESVATGLLSAAMLTPGLDSPHVLVESQGPVSTNTGPCCFPGSVAETE